MMRILVPLGEVPIGEKVTKRNGEKRHRVCDQVRIFRAGDRDKEVVRPHPGHLFLESQGDFNELHATTLVLWDNDYDHNGMPNEEEYR